MSIPTTTKSPVELIAAAEAAKLAEANAGVTGPDLTKTDAAITTTEPKSEVQSKSYQFPSAPTTFEFTHSARRVAIPDGVLEVTAAKDIAELDACVRAGIIYDFIDPTITPFAKPAAPLNPNITN